MAVNSALSLEALLGLDGSKPDSDVEATNPDGQAASSGGQAASSGGQAASRGVGDASSDAAATQPSAAATQSSAETAQSGTAAARSSAEAVAELFARVHAGVHVIEVAGSASDDAMEPPTRVRVSEDAEGGSSPGGFMGEPLEHKGSVDLSMLLGEPASSRGDLVGNLRSLVEDEPAESGPAVVVQPGRDEDDWLHNLAALVADAPREALDTAPHSGDAVEKPQVVQELSPSTAANKTAAVERARVAGKAPGESAHAAGKIAADEPARAHAAAGEGARVAGKAADEPARAPAAAGKGAANASVRSRYADARAFRPERGPEKPASAKPVESARVTPAASEKTKPAGFASTKPALARGSSHDATSTTDAPSVAAPETPRVAASAKVVPRKAIAAIAASKKSAFGTSGTSGTSEKVAPAPSAAAVTARLKQIEAAPPVEDVRAAAKPKGARPIGGAVAARAPKPSEPHNPAASSHSAPSTTAPAAAFESTPPMTAPAAASPQSTLPTTATAAAFEQHTPSETGPVVSSSQFTTSETSPAAMFLSSSPSPAAVSSLELKRPTSDCAATSPEPAVATTAPAAAFEQHTPSAISSAVVSPKLSKALSASASSAATAQYGLAESSLPAASGPSSNAAIQALSSAQFGDPSESVSTSSSVLPVATSSDAAISVAQSSASAPSASESAPPAPESAPSAPEFAPPAPESASAPAFGSGFFRLATARKAMQEEPVAMRWYVLCAVLLLLAVACTCFAVWTASSARETTPLANAAASDSLSLVYSVQGPNGQSHEVRESVSFGADGLAESSTLSIQAENDEDAALLLADAKERFGAAWSGGSVEDGAAVFTVDVRSEHVDQKTYQALIMESTTDARVLDAG